MSLGVVFTYLAPLLLVRLSRLVAFVLEFFFFLHLLAWLGCLIALLAAGTGRSFAEKKKGRIDKSRFGVT